MEEPSGQRPFLKLNLSSGKPSKDAADAAPTDASGAKRDTGPSPSPFVSPPPGLSPSASRTAPVPRSPKPAAPGDGTVVSQDFIGTVPPPAPVSPATEEVEPVRAPQPQPEAISPLPGKKLKLQDCTVAKASPAFDSSSSPAEDPYSAVPIDGKTESALPGATSVPISTTPAAAPVPARDPSRPGPSGLSRPGVLTFVIGGAALVALIAIVPVMLRKQPVGPPPVADAATPVEVADTSSAAVSTSPEPVAPAAAKPPADLGDPKERARTRDGDLTRWLEDARVTSVSADRLTLNRHVYGLGSAVNAEGTLKWVGRDSVTGRLLFTDATGTVYEKSPR